MKNRTKNLLSVLLVITLLTSLYNGVVFANDENTLTQYRSREIKYIDSYVPPDNYDEDWIYYDSEPEERLLEKYEKINIDNVNYYKKFWDDYKVVSTKTHNIGYGYSSRPDGDIVWSTYKLEPSFSETGINGEPLYYMPSYGYMYYRGTTNGLYTLEVYTIARYYYYKYGEWSSWTSSLIEETETVDVESRVLYKKNICYDLNGGSGVLNDSVFQYHTIPTPENPVKNGFEFLGWYKEPDLLTKWDFENDVVDEDLTLYAKWGFDKNVVFFYDDEIEGHRNDVVSVTPQFAVSDSSKAAVIKYKFDTNMVTYSNINANDYKYVSAKVVPIDSQYSYLQVTAQFDTSGYVEGKTFISPYTIKFLINSDAKYEKTKIEVYNIDDAYVLNNSSSKVFFDVCYDMDISVIQNKVSKLEIIGENTINSPQNYTVTVLPIDASNNVQWTVDNEEYAQVTDDGTLLPRRNGTVTIYASTTDGSNIVASKVVTIEGLISYLDNIVFSSNCLVDTFDYSKYNYKVLVDTGVTSVSFTPVFADGLLICDGEFLFSGMEKNIDVQGDSVIITLKFSMGEAKESTYTIEFYKKSIALENKLICANLKNKDNIVSFDIETSLMDEINGTTIIAWYCDDEMIGMEEYLPTDIINFSINSNEIQYIKVMCWDMSGIYPLTDFIEIPLKE